MLLWPELDVSVWLLALVGALLIDRGLGEPPQRWHPVVWMGHYLQHLGERIAPAAQTHRPEPDTRAGVAGTIAWLLGACVCAGLAWLLQHLLIEGGRVVATLGLALLLKPLLAWAMLEREVCAVEQALAQSLSQGRARLAWICSRDTRELTEAQVRETAIESLAENLCDSVVAPLLWFLCLGLPGAALYRFANTADAMWGYRGERGGRIWTWAGRWAARCDDVLSWLPARVTAVALMVVGGMSQAARLPALARQTPSPNGGWPMGAMALVLQVRLGKPGAYVLNAPAPSPEPMHTQRACALSRRAVIALVACAAGGGLWHG